MKPTWDGATWVSKIALPAWKTYLPARARGRSFVQFNPEGADETVPPSALQIATLEHVAALGAALVKSVSTAITKKYKPQIGSRRLAELVELNQVFVQPVMRGKLAYVGFGFSADWDPEHGLGVLTHGTRVVEVGGADTAFLMWIAKRDAKSKRTKR